jgi:hypothetical protein
MTLGPLESSICDWVHSILVRIPYWLVVHLSLLLSAHDAAGFDGCGVYRTVAIQ